jgi:hypothetical protein
MSKYMNGAMNPASLTKPAENKDWKEFYESSRSGYAGGNPPLGSSYRGGRSQGGEGRWG